MTGDTVNQPPPSLAGAFFVPSDRLKELRSIAEQMKYLNGILSIAARVTLVVDTNVILGELLWLIKKRQNPNARTTLMEIIEAGTIVACAPPKLIEEMEEKIPIVAAEKGLDEQAMYDEWSRYRERLEITDPERDLVDRYRQGADPDDADFLALAQTVSAAGVFSKDKHIGQMGGNTISIECVTHLRNYSRAAAIELNIKINGVMVCMLGTAAVRALLEGLRNLIGRIASAPDWVKLALIGALAYVLLNPRARERVTGYLESAFAGIQGATPHVLSFIGQAAMLAETHKNKARTSLDAALKELEVTVEESA